MNKTLTINTGNVLNLLEIKTKPQNVSEELAECIKITMSEWRDGKPQSNGVSHSSDDDNSTSSSKSQTVTLKSPSSEVSSDASKRQSKVYTSTLNTIKSSSNEVLSASMVTSISRSLHDVKQKMMEEEMRNLKVGVKVFIDVDKAHLIRECLDSVFNTLEVDTIDNVILAYYPASGEISATSSESELFQDGIIDELAKDEGENDTEADIAKCEALLPGIVFIWQVFEEYVKQGRILQLGLADTGVRCLRRLFQWAKVKPSIAQINLATCCVVPPALQEFCKANDVQLLTHADPPDLLSAAAIKGLDNMGCERLEWCSRYQVHIKCRGVLTLKGYICKATVLEGKDTINTT